MAIDKAKAQVTTLIKNSAASPTIYFDNAPAFGQLDGIIAVELATRLLVPRSDDTVAVEAASAGHLRCGIAAAVSLRDALDKAIAMATKPAVKLAS